MRCIACNKNLTDFEATRKYKDTSEYLDLCNRCFKSIDSQVEVTENYSLLTTVDVDDDEFVDDDIVSLDEGEL